MLQDVFEILFKKRRDGVYPAKVLDIRDPHGLDRVMVEGPGIVGEAGSTGVWARTVHFMAGAQRGAWFMPEVDDEVLVAFEAGDPRKPYVLGGLWSIEAPPPEQMDSLGDNRVKSLHTRNGIILSFFDANGEEAALLRTPGGQSLVLQDGKGGSVEILDTNGNFIRLAPEGVQISSPGKINLTASTVDITASMVNIDAGVSTFSGMLQADTVIATSVISDSYTNGAGNVW